MQVSGFTSRDKSVDPIEVLNAMDQDDYQSVRGIAQKIGVYPGKDNLDAIMDACRVHQESGVLTSLEPHHTGKSYPAFKYS